MPRMGDTRIPAAPFVAWLESELERLEADESSRVPPASSVPAVRLLASRLGCSERTLLRYRRQVEERKRGVASFTDEFGLRDVDRMLLHAGVEFWEVARVARERGVGGWEAYELDVELEPEVVCPTCRDLSTPIEGVCPWCESVLVDVSERAAA